MVLPSGTSPCPWSFLLFLVLQKLTLLQTEPFGYEDKRMGENANKVNPWSQGCLSGGVRSWGGESPYGRKKGRKAVGLSGQEQEYSFHQECISRLDRSPSLPTDAISHSSGLNSLKRAVKEFIHSLVCSFKNMALLQHGRH